VISLDFVQNNLKSLHYNGKISYCDHLQAAKNVVDSVKMKDVRATEAGQEQISCSEMGGRLAFKKWNSQFHDRRN
jgi:hypothetical protein